MVEKEILIISVFYNRESLVDDCCRSLIENLPNNADLYLVDDGSKDSTLDLLRTYESNRVKVIGQANKGFVQTIIDVISKTEHKFIAIHGSGDHALNNRFIKQYMFLKNNPDFALCGSLMELVYPNFNRPTQVSGQYFSGNAEKEIINRSVVTHGEVMISRRHYNLVGGYRKYFKFAQDRDLWCRLSRVGKFHVLNEVLYRKLCNLPGSVSGTPEKTLIQRTLSDFAIWCHKEVLSGNVDPLERYGDYASLLRPKSIYLEKVFLRDFCKSICMYESEHSKLFIDAASNESVTYLSKLIKYIYLKNDKILKFPITKFAKLIGKV